jgi:hypothetical protein
MTRSESNRGLRTTRQYKHSWTVKPSVLYRDSASANSIALQHLSMSIVRRGHLKYSRVFRSGRIIRFREVILRAESYRGFLDMQQ